MFTNFINFLGGIQDIKIALIFFEFNINAVNKLLKNLDE